MFFLYVFTKCKIGEIIMLNAPIAPNFYNAQPAPMQSQPIQQQQISQNTNAPQDAKQTLREQSLAITADICAEYGAVARLNDILIALAKDIKTEQNQEQKKVLEARIGTINQMLLQRESKINQMETARANIDAQLK